MDDREVLTVYEGLLSDPGYDPSLEQDVRPDRHDEARRQAGHGRGRGRPVLAGLDRRGARTRRATWRRRRACTGWPGCSRRCGTVGPNRWPAFRDPDQGPPLARVAGGRAGPCFDDRRGGGGGRPLLGGACRIYDSPATEINPDRASPHTKSKQASARRRSPRSGVPGPVADGDPAARKLKEKRQQTPAPAQNLRPRTLASSARH